jgi:phosphoribosylcarboxyaminoimidazole (NCAIR) mutase
MAIGKGGATNAAVLTAQILAVSEPAVADKIKDYKRLLVEKVERAAERLGK